MTDFLPGRSYRGRLVDLAGMPPARAGILVGDRLLLAEADPALLAGLAPGDLVVFVLGAPGRLESVLRTGGPAPGARWETGDALRWRRPGAAGGRMARLRLRHRVLQAVRAVLDGEGFTEIDTPVLVRAPSPEPQFAPIPAGDGYLITSPEFQLKRLLVGGFERIYRIGPVFRGAERGRHHNPEFTLLEWYRVGADLDALAADLERLLGRVAALSARRPGTPGLDPVALGAPLRRARVADLFAEHLGVRLQGVVTAEGLRAAALAAGVPEAAALPADFERAFFALWGRIEPRLGPAPLLVTHWPAPLASLARLAPDDPTVAERMELYAGGLELANGFAELTDAAEQRRRFQADLAARAAQGLPPLPLDEAFLDALAEGLPPCAGMALGLERLVMLLAGTDDIRDVLPFAWDER